MKYGLPFQLVRSFLCAVTLAACGAASAAYPDKPIRMVIGWSAGDNEIVVSATPSENTVCFYLGRGYRPMAQPLAELLALEPEDIHMGKVI